ncbi:MAG: DMT family transporter [Chloroflexi bacterium]|nr:MAG: DMT family transporter [Chloroflexota bacterium]
MFLGELAALGTAVCWSLTAIFFSYSGRLVGSDVVNRSRLVFAFILLALTHWLTLGQVFPWQTEPFRWGWLAVSSLLGLVLGDTFLFRAYVLLGPRLAMLLMSTVPVFSTLLGWLLFSERVTAVELVGICVAVGGIAWVVTEQQNGRTITKNRDYRRGILFGLAGALGQVANLVTARYALTDNYSPLSATLIRILIALIILWGIALWQGQAAHTLRQWRHPQAFPAILGGAFSGPFLGIWLSLIAIQLSRLGIAATLMALPPVLLIPLEYVIYRHPISLRSATGTLIAFIGVAILFWPG